MNELENLISQFNSDNLNSLMRAKSRTFRKIDESLSHLNDDQFKDCTLFGEFKVNEEGLMVVIISKVNKPLSERSGKKAQYTLGKKFLKESQRYVGGFFIFYDDKGDFRFSLIYDIPLATGKRDWSNFRRYTYFVSKDQTNKTFIKQIEEADFSSLEKIIEAFSVEKVTKQFYQEIANWYFWAMDKVEFPDDEEKDKEKRNAKNLIRLITRIIFIWFMKEKDLVPSTLFEKSYIDKIIDYKDKTGSTYYKAILQNLFFATLNTPMKKDDEKSRIFVDEAIKRDYASDAYLQQGYYRYSRFIKDKKLFFELFENIPFLNGGLFESLDKKIDGKEIRVDCFSDNPKNETRLKVPDELFFLDNEKEIDLSNYLEKGKNKKVTGLLTILKRYNFTIDENTPIDQDVALDPELLGKVFENLLASYNPETATTARKATGSYYTPREIVEYMVNESLIEYLKSSRILPDPEKESNRILPDSEGNSRSQEASGTFFNPYEDVHLFYGKHGKLPHMQQGSVWYFVTFRLADSLPKEKVEQLEKEREQWLKLHEGKKDKLTEEDKKEYYRLFSERVEEWLNNGYGSCILKDERIAKIVADALLYFNGQRYDLDDWVIMPNHVHLLIRPKENYNLSDMMHSIKSYTAHKINELLNSKGNVWMHESYDHIVRNEEAFYAIKNYIRRNPEKVKIKLPDVCSSWKNVNESSRFGDLRSQEASSTFSGSQEASSTFSGSQEASDTLFRKLFNYSSDENPFEDEQTTLKVIDAIEKIKILDPACGSGAFPMGVLHKLVLALHKLDPDNKIWKQRVLNRVPAEIRSETEQSLQNKSIDYIRKLGLIENCIYGVDIQEIAIQISKLRFFISLLVEQQIDDTKPNRDIRALPNLETKFVAANTLIGLNRPAQMSLVAGEVEELENKLFEVREEIFYTNSRREKLELQKREKQLREKLKTALKQNGFQNDVAEKITSWDPFDQNTHADWFDPEWMFGVKVTESSGFDIVIGNPPYIQLQKAINDKSKLKYADLYKDQNYKTFERTGDIYCLFYEKGINLLKTGGYLCYITSNKWMRAGYGESLREFFTKHNPKVLIDLGPGIFESATVDTNILLIQKAKNQNNLHAVTLKKEDGVDIAKQLKENGVILTNLSKDAWFIGSSAEQKLKEKIERIGKPLKDWDVNIYYGIKTGLNEAFIITTEKRNEILANCKDEDERKRTEAIIKPILRGRDIKRYYYEWAGLWVIGTFPALHLDIENYPALKKYFLDNFDIRQLEQSGKKYPKLGFDARKKTGNKWFETQDQIAYYPEFEKEKIIYIEIMTDNWEEGYEFPCYTYKNDTCFVLNTAYIMTGKNLKYILGVLNSNFGSYLVKQHVTQLQKRQFRMLAQYVNNFEIPPITPANQPIVSQIEALVDKILKAKKQNPQADTKNFEEEIDQLVYKLYNLTPEEIKIIEGGKNYEKYN